MPVLFFGDLLTKTFSFYILMLVGGGRGHTFLGEEKLRGNSMVSEISQTCPVERE